MIPPPPSLASLVRFFWVFEVEWVSGAQAPYIYRVMADGCPEMIFHYRGRFGEITDNAIQPSFVSGIHGQSARFTRFCIREPFGIFGAYLYPFALDRLFSIPAGQLSNRMIDLPMLLGPEGRVLEERMLTAESNTERFKLLCAFLESRRSKKERPDSPVYPAIRKLIRENGAVAISQLADYQNLSLRHFERKFKEAAGLSPKLFARILRFNRCLKSYGTSYRSLTDLAYECGYYDQSHFIHDFREFSGYLPKSYFSGRPEGIEWMTG